MQNLRTATGPNQGYFGALGRNMRGQPYYDFDFSLIKDTPVEAHPAAAAIFGSHSSRRF